MGKYLGREDILNCIDARFQDVEVPEWDGTVRVRSLTGLQRSKLLEISEKIKTEEWIERVVAACICDENGNPIFTQEDVQKLAEKNSAALNRVFEVADRLNGMSGRSIEEIKGE